MSDVTGGAAGVRDWWEAVCVVGLVGTDRRPVPEPPRWAVPAREDGTPPTRLLDAAALGSAWLAAGAVPGRGSAPDPAPAETRPEAGQRARQLLDVLLVQPPGGTAHQQLLLRTWLRACATAGRRVPHDALTAVIALARSHPGLRPPLREAAGERGAWLARLDPTLTWWHGPGEEPASPAPGTALADDPVVRWAAAGSADRTERLRRLRAADPVLARELLRTSWSAEPARVRAEQLATLVVGLGPDDEDLLEPALDDRAAGVREVAQDLLDRLPGSARAARMAERLRPLLSVSGTLRRTVRVDLPDEPDVRGVRDGLGPAPARTSVRGHHLRRIVRGAPVDTWTAVTGLDPRALFGAVRDEELRALLHAAVVAQGERRPEWVRVAFAVDPAPALVPLLPPGEQQAAVERVLTAGGPAGLEGAVGLFTVLPGPWSPETSERVVRALRAGRGGAAALAGARDVLAERLHPAAGPQLRSWANHDSTADVHRRSLAALAAAVSTRHAVLDAFSGEQP
ncbi:DUF5691 domain-containing protein [Phycicoccus flavus]|uniref:DUF5691 domain-containing protein n=1 Tax=Phycicoccus flavus TaxID=2502783 RepID=UPI000FEB9545|nr:DUF5691 domain-containing protein [Phycicoccus flavus]NHA69323.1 hypothetical protein [Phycicoccus flavus]